MMTPTRFRPATLAMIGLAHLLAACTTLPPPEPKEPPEPVAVASPSLVNETAMLPLLGYYHLLQRMTPTELTRERQTLNSLLPSPSVQVRLSMLLGMPRTTTDLARALALLDAVQRSHDTEAASLHPLARLLATQYQERLKLDQERLKFETQNDRLSQQLKDSQRKRDELQEKIEALTNIERSIPVRPNPVVRPAP